MVCDEVWDDERVDDDLIWMNVQMKRNEMMDIVLGVEIILDLMVLLLNLLRLDLGQEMMMMMLHYLLDPVKKYGHY